MGLVRDEIREILTECTGLSSASIEESIDLVPAGRWGAYGTSLPFRLAAGEQPYATAERLAARANGSSRRRLTTAEAHGPFVNFAVTSPDFLTDVWTSWREAGSAGPAATVVIETAPPNIGAAFNLVHYRATCIAHFLATVHRRLGHPVERHLFWNDCGSPAAALVEAFRRRGDAHTLATDPAGELRRLQAAAPGGAAGVVRDIAAGIEAGTSRELSRTWWLLREAAWREIEARYAADGFRFDRVFTESEQWELLGRLRTSLVTAGAAEVDRDGSVVARLGGRGLPDTVLFRADGTSLYLARDLAAHLRRRHEDVWRHVYVVSRNQQTHFRQLFALADDVDGPRRVSEFVHAAFGLVRPARSSPEELIAAARAEARRYLDRHGLAGLDPERVGDLAFRLFVLHRQRTTDITFDARAVDVASLGWAVRLLRHAAAIDPDPETRTPGPAHAGDAELAVLVSLDETYDALRATAQALEPHVFLRHVLRLSRALDRLPPAGERPVRRGVRALAAEVFALALRCLGPGAVPASGPAR